MASKIERACQAQAARNQAQQVRNQALIAGTAYMRGEVVSNVLPLRLDLAKRDSLTAAEKDSLRALEITAARTAVKSLASLAKIGELDHLGGGLDLIPALTLTLAAIDHEKSSYTIENAHCSIGYFGVLSAFGYLAEELVVEKFRRGLDIPGHVSWVPGGTQLSGGRLGVMVPVAVGAALGKRARYGEGAWMVCHCGDAGWISGQALNGFNAADLTHAPVTFVMHRNGIQLSGSNKQVMDKDPRPIIASLGVQILETPSLNCADGLMKAYHEAYLLAQQGKPSMIYPTGAQMKLSAFAEHCGIGPQVEAFAKKHGVDFNRQVWIPGALMSYRDVACMLECIFLVNELPGGAGHHDGHMKGRNADEVLANPMLTLSAAQQAALAKLQTAAKRTVVTKARPAPGSANLVVGKEARAKVELPGVGKSTSARGGSQAAYELVAKTFPKDVFVISCDLDPSTKLDKARKHIAANQQYEVSIEEQIATLMCNGLAMATPKPQLNVISTFSAFFEGIAREGFEMWRYQRNLTGANEGLNVVYHLSHVGANTGRDHFSGWSLDWITVGLGYLPYLHRFYAPADLRSAFIAVCDCAAHYGAHIVAIPRDNLPILAKQDGSGPLYNNTDDWTAVTAYRQYPGAQRAFLAVGAPSSLAGDAAEKLLAAGVPTDVHIVNGFPLGAGELAALLARYPQGVVTVEDGIIATPEESLRGFAGMVQSVAAGSLPLAHIGISDPRVAPSEGFEEVWQHFGITVEAMVEAAKGL